MELPIKIILADDEPLFRSGISFLLQREEGIEVVYEASDGEDLITYLKANTPPDIIIMDLKMPGLNGVEATKIITETFPYIKIIALTSYGTQSFMANMINIGAASYLVKNTTPRNLIFTIKEVARKGFYYDDETLRAIKESSSSIKKNPKFTLDTEGLTKREIEILKLICKQNSNKEIADKLFINTRIVEGHRNNLMFKTNAKNIASLIIFALQNEYITLEELI